MFKFRAYSTQVKRSLKDSRFKKLRVNAADPIISKKEFLYGDNINVIHAFENALKIGSPLDIYHTINVVKDRKLLKNVHVSLLETMVRMVSKGHFGFLGGYKGYDFAKQVATEYSADGKTTSEIDALLIKCFKFASNETMPVLIKDFKSIISKYPNKNDQLLIYLSLFHVLRNQNCLEACEELFAMLSKKNLDMTKIFLNMCQAYAAAGNVEKAEEMYETLQAQGLKTSNDYLITLIQGFAAQGIEF